MSKPENLSTFEFFQKFPNEEAARKFFEGKRWGDEPVCGHCGSVSVTECKDHKPMPYRCKDCRKHFSVRTGTVLAESRLPLQKWLLTIFMLTSARKGIPSTQMARALGLKSEGGNAFMKTLSGKKLGSEIDRELWERIENPVVFNPDGPDPAHGYEAEVLVDVCKAVVRAHNSGVLTKKQEPMARQAQAIVNALASVGSAMAACKWPKPVSVCSYIRFRFGRWERVVDHCRSWPRR